MLRHLNKAIRRNLLITQHLLKSQHTNLPLLPSQHTNHLPLPSQRTDLHLPQRPNINPHLHPRHLISPHNLNQLNHNIKHQNLFHQDLAIHQGPDPVMDHLLSRNQAMGLLLRKSQVMAPKKNQSLLMDHLSSNMDHPNNSIDQLGRDQANSNSRRDHKITMAHQNNSTTLRHPNMLHLSHSQQRNLLTKSQSQSLATHHQNQVMVPSKLLK